MAGAIACTDGAVWGQQQSKQAVEFRQPLRECNGLALEGIAQILDAGRIFNTISYCYGGE